MKLIPLGTPILCGQCQVGQLQIAPGNPNITINDKQVVTQQMVMTALMTGCPKQPPGSVPCTTVMSIVSGLVPHLSFGGQVPVDETLTITTVNGPIQCKMQIADQVSS